MLRGKRYKIIKEVLDANDPMGLLALGCPDDEYCREAYLIEERRNEGDLQNQQRLGEIISGVFCRQFDTSLSKEACRKIASEIIEKLAIECD